MRPHVPELFHLESFVSIYIPDLTLWDWCRQHLLDESSPLFNPDHLHLLDANIGFLWTNQENASKGRRIIGQAEELVFRCGKWQKGRQEQQIMEWFECIPDFLITLDAIYCLECSDAEFLMLIEHELYHCGQKIDSYGMPKFNSDTGEPEFGLKGHDVEEFIGVVRRYGVGNPDGNLAKLVTASLGKPDIAEADISKMCGTCRA